MFDAIGKRIPIEIPIKMLVDDKAYEDQFYAIEYKIALTDAFKIAAITSPDIKPGIAKVKAYNVIVKIKLPLLKPNDLNIPNSNVFSSMSPSIKE